MSDIQIYNTLTIDQIISLKGVFTDRRYRDFLPVNHNTHDFDMIYAVALLWNWKTAIEYYLTEDITLLQNNDLPYINDMQSMITLTLMSMRKRNIQTKGE